MFLFFYHLISNISNIVYLAPTNKEEYLAMMEWGIEQDNHPVAIRVPSNGVVSTKEKVEADFFGATKEFTDKIDINELYNRYHLSDKLIVEDIKNILNKVSKTK